MIDGTTSPDRAPPADARIFVVEIQALEAPADGL